MITFTVANGRNPTPYKRTTQKAKFSKEYQVYQAYKSLVVAEFIKTSKCMPHQLLMPNTKYYVSVMAYFKDKKHGDTDNVAKAVNDAIFQKPLNDKYVAGNYDFDYDKENPRLEIHIREAE